MEELENYIGRLMETFEEQPAAMRAAVEAHPKKGLHEPLGPGEWTPHQVVAHVVAADELALLPRLQRILEEEAPHLPDWDEEHWMEAEYDPQVAVGGLIDRWASLRADLVPALQTDNLSIWNRTGVHPTRRERTLLWWLEYSVAHARDHLEQLGTV